MNKKELAEHLNGREYGEEIARFESKVAEESGLVVVYGASDDLTEFEGAIYDEVGCYDGGTIYLDSNGILDIDCDNPDCPLLKRHLKQCKTIESIWDKDGYSWTYKTDIPHETFEIMEDGEKYCRGIVFDITELEAVK
jgi:hypothetical protein